MGRTRTSEVVCGCGARLERIEESVSFRDHDTYYCPHCKEEIEDFSGAAVLRFKLIEKPNANRT